MLDDTVPVKSVAPLPLREVGNLPATARASDSSFVPDHDGLRSPDDLAAMRSLYGLYARRNQGPKSVYSRFLAYIRQTTFIGHDHALDGVTPTISARGDTYFGRNSDVATFLIWGEMASQDQGVMLGAHGDKFPRSSMVYSNDRIKQRFVLRCPTAASPEIRAAWEAQLQGIKNLITKAEEEYARVSGGSRTFAKSVTACRSSVDLETGRLRNTDVISLVPDQPLYVVRRRIGPDYDLRVPDVSPESALALTLEARKAVQYPLRVGNTYDASVLRDHHDYRFRYHQHARVTQLNHLGHDGKLVEPWREGWEFRQGTLTSMVFTAHCWFIEMNTRGLPERYYQLQVKAARVVHASPDKEEVIPCPPPPDYYDAMRDFEAFVAL